MVNSTLECDPDRFTFGTPTHNFWLRTQAIKQFEFFRASVGSDPGFQLLGQDGKPLADKTQELHTTTRLTHSYALGKRAGIDQCDRIIDQGMDYIWQHHRDPVHGGYFWAMDSHGPKVDTKLAYGHVFVLLAAASAKQVGHPDADRLLGDVSMVLNDRFWDEEYGLFLDEWTRDWNPFSTYRGLNANMHAVEALLAAFEATEQVLYLERAGRILDFFLRKIAPTENWHLPEHYQPDWQVDRDYSGDPMFRPAGTTPGHSFEMSRLLLHYWDLCGRESDGSIQIAWDITQRALADAWDPDFGGLIYSLNFDGSPAIRARYWWPMTEAIGVLACFLKLDGTATQYEWYSRLWRFAEAHFIDPADGGWFPEIDRAGKPISTQFKGKPDIYHSIQATLFPMNPQLSRLGDGLPGLLHEPAE